MSAEHLLQLLNNVRAQTFYQGNSCEKCCPLSGWGSLRGRKIWPGFYPPLPLPRSLPAASQALPYSGSEGSNYGSHLAVIFSFSWVVYHESSVLNRHHRLTQGLDTRKVLGVTDLCSLLRVKRKGSNQCFAVENVVHRHGAISNPKYILCCR